MTCPPENPGSPHVAAPPLPPGARFDRRIMERVQRAARRLMSADAPDTLEEANAKLQAALEAHGGDLPTPMEMPADRALERCYAAYGAACAAEVERLAREALAHDPECPEAFELLAESLVAADPPDIEGALAHLLKAAELGRRRVPDTTWNEMKGRLYGEVEARVVLRAKAAIAALEEKRGNLDRAVRIGRELLRLDAEDRLGIRYPHMVRLMRDGRDREALDHALEEIERMGRVAEGPTEALLIRACALFRIEGDVPEARDAFEDAMHENRALVGFLMDPRGEVLDVEDVYGGEARQEAQEAVALIAPLWGEDPALKEWFFGTLKDGLMRAAMDLARSPCLFKPPKPPKRRRR